MLLTRTVGDNQRRPWIRFRFLNGFHRLVELRPQRNLRDVDVSIHHHADAQIFTRLALAVLTKFRDRPQWRCFRGLSAGVGIALSIKHQNIDVFGQAQDMIKTAETNIVGPPVAADQPDRFFNQRVSISQELFSSFNTLKRVAQFSNLRATNVRCGLRMQGIIQFCRDLSANCASRRITRARC